MLRYIENVVTLALDETRCGGCGVCETVCPRAVLALQGQKGQIVDRGACIECGACAHNCPTGALSVDSGVGCAWAVLRGALRGSGPDCGCARDSPCCG